MKPKKIKNALYCRLKVLDVAVAQKTSNFMRHYSVKKTDQVVMFLS